MKWISKSIPVPSEGQDFSNAVDQLVPDQSMSLQEIIKRFTRGEALPVGMETNPGDEDLDNPLNVDLEKLANADLVDKDEYKDKLKEVQRKYDAQEKAKAKKKAEADKAAVKAADEERIRLAAEKLAKESSGKSA